MKNTISSLPSQPSAHIIASALVNLVNMLDSDQEYMKTIAAGGFRDITRIASSFPDYVGADLCGK